ncbi:MAG: DUF4421 domain-containing protein [Cyclobacteriaceae bacterium]|nr:DUF4421 domain-containing protein [Cyclobacteriaceae bacterium]
MKAIRLVFLIGIIALPQHLSAQIIKGVALPKIEIYHYDTNYIESYNSKLALRFVIPKRVDQFTLKNTLTNQKYVYNANEHYGFGLGITYRWLAVDLTINPAFTQPNTAIFGETDEFNLKGSAYLKRHVIDGYLRRYKGYYVSNANEVTPSWQPGSQYPFRSDVQTVGWGFNYTIPFNWEKYSPKVVFVLDGQLKKSAGSFMAVSSLYFYHLRADSSIVDDTFSAEAQIRRLNIALIGQLFGYSYTHVHKNFYASASVLPGLTYALGTIFSEAGSYSPKFTPNFKLMLRAGVGYNSERWYTGVYLIVDNNQMTLPANLALSNALGEFRIFVGYRIKPPKIVDDVMDKL